MNPFSHRKVPPRWKHRWPSSDPVVPGPLPPITGAGSMALGGFAYAGTGIGGVTNDPVLPRAVPSVAPPSSFGATWFVDDYASLVNAINNSAVGDLIECDADAARIQAPIATTVWLPVKAGFSATNVVTIRSSRWTDLPTLESTGRAPGAPAHAASGIPATPGTLTALNNPRVLPSMHPFLAKFRVAGASDQGTSNAPFFRVRAGGGGWYLWGLDIDAAPSSGQNQVNGMIRFGDLSPSDGFDSLAKIVQFCTLQQSYIHSNADRTYGNMVNYHASGKAVYLCGNHVSVANSFCVSEHSGYGDNNAVYIAGGLGPVLIDNNTQIANGENFLSGGGDLPSYYAGRNQSDITFTRNFCYKPRVWFYGLPEYGGTPYPMKNPFEIKAGLYWDVSGNVFDGNTAKHVVNGVNIQEGQNGQGVTIKTVNQYGTQYWVETGHVTLRYNKTINCTSGLQLAPALALENGGTGIAMHDILYENNLQILPTGRTDAGSKAAIIWGGETTSNNWRLRRNTWAGAWNHYGNILSTGDQLPFAELLNNIFGTTSLYGFKGPSLGIGNASIALLATDLDMRANALIGQSASAYSNEPGNYFPTSATGNLNADGTLPAGSQFLAGNAMDALDGSNLGCDMAGLAAAISGVELEV